MDESELVNVLKNKVIELPQGIPLAIENANLLVKDYTSFRNGVLVCGTDVCKIMACTLQTLQNRRKYKNFPTILYPTARRHAVRYDLGEVLAWLKDHNLLFNQKIVDEVLANIEGA